MSEAVDDRPSGTDAFCMSPLPKSHFCRIVGLLLFVCVSGCGQASMIGRSVGALEKTAQSMDKTREVLRQSDQTMKEMSSALRKLDEPMRRVAALGAPMRNLAALEPVMERLGTHLEGVEGHLERLEQPLEKVATLTGPLQDVAALGAKMDAISNLGGNREEVTTIVMGVMAAWALVTFLGVYLGVMVGMRRLGQKGCR